MRFLLFIVDAFMLGEVTLLKATAIVLAVLLFFVGTIFVGRKISLKPYLVSICLLLWVLAYSFHYLLDQGIMTSPADLALGLAGVFAPFYIGFGLSCGQAMRSVEANLAKALERALEILEEDRLCRRQPLVIADDLAIIAKLLSGLSRAVEAEQYYMEAVALVEKEVPDHQYLAGVYREFLKTIASNKSGNRKIIEKKLAALKLN
jgi:hypothetical protein